MPQASRISPEDAKKLLDSNQGYVYLDVRSTPEFKAGHVPGAHSIPLLEAVSGIMAPNPRFLDSAEVQFSKDTRIIVGCQHGVRSQRAAQMLTAAGFTNIVDMRGGFEGELDHCGCITYPGWSALGLPVSKS
jgi:rhodanese-related sulfurtransferase